MQKRLKTVRFIMGGLCFLAALIFSVDFFMQSQKTTAEVNNVRVNNLSVKNLSVKNITTNHSHSKIELSHSSKKPYIKRRVATDQPSASHYSKLTQGVLSVSIIEIEHFVDDKTGNKTSLLKGTITANQDLSNVHYKWVTPDEISVLSGHQTGQRGEIKKGASTEVTLEINYDSSQNYTVYLHSYFQDGQKRLGSSASYQTKGATHKVKPQGFFNKTEGKKRPKIIY